MSRPEEYCKEVGWEVIHRFVIPRVGWEMDNDGVIARDEEFVLRVVTTNHGGIRVDDEYDGEAIKEHRDNVAEWLKGLDAALKLMEGTPS